MSKFACVSAGRLLIGALFLAVAGALAGAEDAKSNGAPEAVDSADILTAVAKALPLIEAGANGHLDNRSCFTCHHQAMPVVAMQAARERKLEVNGESFQKQLDRTLKIITGWAKRTPDRKSFGGGQADTAVYALLALDVGKHAPDDATEAVVEYLLMRDAQRGYWRTTHYDRRPTEGSDFATTALALRGLQAFGTERQQERVAKRTEDALAWLRKTEPKDTEDRVFRLWAFHYAGGSDEEIKEAADALQATQRNDGGWAQTAELESDAYATGTALAALKLAGRFKTSEASYQRGVRYLLKQQQEDGSWRVESRSENRFQSYFETGFPHKKDQWISMAATCWAATALLLSE